MKISFMSKSSESELSEGGSFIQESKSKFSGIGTWKIS